MSARWISSVLLLVLGLASGPGASADEIAGASKTPVPVPGDISNPTVSLLWAVMGSEDGVAVGDGFVLTTDTATVPMTFMLPSLSSLADGADGPALAEATDAQALTAKAAITEVALGPISPNPNHGQASVTFALPRASQVHLAIFDLQGRQMQVLANGVLEAGPHTVAWQSMREQGARTAGIYFVQLATPERVINRRMVVTY